MEYEFCSSEDGEIAHLLASKDVTELESSDTSSAEEEKPYEVNLINSTVYIISMALQVSTFAINYRVNTIS